jgi:predicted enzyme related to lactoylglutathione lyase
MPIDNAIASLAVRDVNAAGKWYEVLLGRRADSRPMPEAAEWKFPRGGWLQIYQLPQRAGTGSCTLSVSDIEETVQHVRTLGIDVSQRTGGPKVKTLMIVDPDGNHIAFAEAIDTSMAR